MLFLENLILGEGGGERGSLFFVRYGQKQVLIIVDMILSWKNILWFQRVSEHVLELRALWDLRVKGLHYSFWLCGKKKNILYILSFKMLMKVYLYCLFPPIDRFTRSLGAEFIDVHILLCVLRKRKKLYISRGGGRFSGTFGDYSTVKMCHVFNKKKEKKSTYQPTVWPVCHLVYSISLFVANFFSVGRQGAGLWDCLTEFVSGSSCGTLSERRGFFSLFDISCFNSIKHHHIKMLRGTEKHHPAREWCGGSWILKKKKKVYDK